MRSSRAFISVLAICAAAMAALSPSAGARTVSIEKGRVGRVTVVANTVRLRGHKVPGRADLFAGSLVATNRRGQARLELKLKKTQCDVYPNTRATVVPIRGVVWYAPTGSIYCGTSPASTRPGRFKGKRGLEIDSKDPIFALVNRPGTSIVKVTRGFVVVRGRGGEDTAVVVARNQQVAVPAGGDPGSPQAIQLSARERATLARLGRRFPPPADRRAPTTTIVDAPPAATPNTAATFSFKADEPRTTFACELDGGGFHPCVTPKTYEGLAEGAHNFSVQAVDAAGNRGAAATYRWLVDRTPPTSSIACDGSTCAGAWYPRPVSVTLSGTDSGSGLARIRYTLDGSEPTPTNGRDYVEPLVVQSATILTYRAYDKAGNAEAPHRQALNIDPVPPTVALLYPKANSTVPDETTLRATAADNVAVDRVEFLVDGTVVATVKSEPYTTRHVFGSGEDGPHTAVARAFDPAGNVAESSTAFFVVLPDLTVSVDQSSITQSCESFGDCVTSASFTIVNGTTEWGAADAGPFDVLMQASSGASKTLHVDGLAADSALTFTDEQLPPDGDCFVEPGCTITVTVDSAGAVPEAFEGNNVDQETAAYIP